MWTLTHNLPPNYSIVAPRGPYPALEGGFSWRNDGSKRDSLSSRNDLRPAAEGLMEFVDTWAASEGINIQQFDLIGFSQGAAMVYILTLLYPDRVRKIAALAGFLPQGAEELLVPSQLTGKQIFISHGRNDTMVQVEKARRAVKLFRETGAQVTYCESDAAHKVSKECLRALGKFLEMN
jgi:phospholipase/carboxylesterase